MTSSLERSRLTLGALLVTAALALGAGSSGLEAMRAGDEAPLIETMDAQPAASVKPTATPQPAPSSAPRADVEEAASAPAPEKVPALPDTDAASDESVAEEAALLVLEGGASWYSDALSGRRTASGEPYDPASLIAAHRALPFGTRLRVTNLANDRVVEVRVVDRGPFVAGRVLDLSRRAAEEIGIIRAGHARVRIEVLEYGE